MDYGDILRRAWQVTWRNKGLWLLGILAGCSGDNGGNPSQSFSYQRSAQDFPFLDRTFADIPPETMTLIVVAAVALILLLAVVFLVIGTLGQAGLIAGINRADEQGSVSLGEAWRLGVTHFWRLLGVTLLAGAVVLVVAIVVAGVVTLGAVATLGLGLICLLPLVCLLIPLALLAGVYLKLVQNAVVVEKLGVIEAFRRAWNVARENLGPVVVVGLILILIGAIAGLVVAAPFLIAALPALVVLSSGQNVEGLMIAGLVCAAIYLPVMLVASGVLRTFVDSSWTLTYRRLIGLPSAAPEAA